MNTLIAIAFLMTSISPSDHLISKVECGNLSLIYQSVEVDGSDDFFITGTFFNEVGSKRNMCVFNLSTDQERETLISDLTSSIRNTGVTEMSIERPRYSISVEGDLIVIHSDGGYVKLTDIKAEKIINWLERIDFPFS